jgi:hypothetical protein
MTYWHPLHIPSSEIIGVNVAAEEITKRKRAEAALQASERRFHTLADSMWMADAGGRDTFFCRWVTNARATTLHPSATLCFSPATLGSESFSNLSRGRRLA